MSYEERKKKRLKKKRIRKIIMISFFIYLILRSLPNVLAKKSRTILPEKYNLVEGVDTQGILIMEESVYNTVEDIDFQDSLEGERVPVGFEIANIDGLSNTSSLEEELTNVEKDINVLNKFKNENNFVEKDIEKIQDSQEELIKQLKEEIHSGDYSDIEDITDKLSKKDNKISELNNAGTLIDQSLENLEERKNKLLNDINENNIVYISETAGLLSYKIDGYEKTYIPKEFENYNYDNLKIPSDLKKKEAEDNIEFNGFKIIDNFKWYVALKIDDPEDVKKYSENDYISLKFKDFDEEISGTIFKINKNRGKMVIIVEITEELDKYYDVRFPMVSIIIEKRDVYKLPIKALVNKGDQIGVYIKEFNGVVKFKPLLIIKKDKEYAYVDIGDDNGLIELEGTKDPVKTITSYDEIFINSFNIKEGQILD